MYTTRIPRVVVTGMGAVTPIGLSVDTFWQGLIAGTSGAARITRFDPTPLATQFACEVKGFDPLQYLDRKEARHMDTYCHFAIAATEEALHDAQLEPEKLTEQQREHMGVLIGTGVGGFKTFQHQAEVYLQQGVERISPYFIPMIIANMASSIVSMRYKVYGPCHTVVSACATGNHALADAMHAIQRGDADIMICGGSEASICEMAIGGFNAMKALSTRNEAPAQASRPFDAERDGFVMGEGAGVLILEALPHAQERGARIYAEMLGVGIAADAYHMTSPAVKGQALALQHLMRQAQITPEHIDYINLHGTSTQLGDRVETQSIKQVFGDDAYRLHLSSTKSMLGHLFGAAGSIEAIATILTLCHGIIPPTINLTTPDPECDLNYTPNVAVQAPLQIGVSNAFGFGGHSTSVGFRRWDMDSEN